MRSFSVRKFFLQLFCTFFGERLLAQKLHIKCWWNWPLESAWLEVEARKRVLSLLQFHPNITNLKILCKLTCAFKSQQRFSLTGNGTCAWFTYFPKSKYCQLLEGCETLDAISCPECLSGEGGCQVSISPTFYERISANSLVPKKV